MILCIGTTPAAQRVMVFRKLQLDAVNRAATTLDGAAGKAVNVAKVLHALGAPVLLTGFIGGDRGHHLVRDLTTRGIQTDFIEVEPCTRQCVTVIDESAGTITELVEESSPVSAADYDRLTGLIRQRLSGCQAVIMSGTLTPGAPEDFYLRCTQMAHEAGALTILDARGAPLLQALKASPGLIKPNRSELAATLGRSLPDETAVIAGMRELVLSGAQRIVVTAGEGATLALDSNAAWRIIPPRIKPLNPIGSGDAFAAALAWRLTQGDNLGEACRRATAAGAANALTLMPGEVDASALEHLAQQTSVLKIG
jgi:tagatose 6-phosphate kinase